MDGVERGADDVSWLLREGRSAAQVAPSPAIFPVPHVFVCQSGTRSASCLAVPAASPPPTHPPPFQLLVQVPRVPASQPSSPVTTSAQTVPCHVSETLQHKASVGSGKSGHRFPLPPPAPACGVSQARLCRPGHLVLSRLRPPLSLRSAGAGPVADTWCCLTRQARTGSAPAASFGGSAGPTLRHSALWKGGNF